MLESHDADVVVVGCGPAGVMAALRSAQHGLRVGAVDMSTEIYPLPRAIGMDADGQRLFHTAGLAATLAEHSSPMSGAEFVTVDGERVVGFDLPDGYIGPLGHPPMVAFEQPGLEAGLRKAAVEAGVDMRLGVEATGLDITPDGVDLTTTAGPLSARWVIGADGASSWVRRTIGIPLEDQGFDQPWLVVDTTLLDPELSLPQVVQQICDPDRVVTVVRGHGTRRRWEFQLRPDETRDQMLEPETIQSLLTPWGTPAQLRIDRSAVYRFHGLVAQRFGNGRVFLVGDAAHQMPPFNGQGMCSGLRDADNLAWKMGLVHRGLAGERLLDTYDLERRPHSVDTVAHSCDAGRLIDDIAAGVDVSPESGYGGGRPTPFLEEGFVDGEHRAVGKPLPQPTIDGTPLDELMGDGFALIAAHSIDVPEVWQRLGAASVRVPSDALPGIVEGNSIVIVRPDRYVAAVTTDLTATTNRLLAQL